MGTPYQKPPKHQNPPSFPIAKPSRPGLVKNHAKPFKIPRKTARNHRKTAKNHRSTIRKFHQKTHRGRFLRTTIFTSSYLLVPGSASRRVWAWRTSSVPAGRPTAGPSASEGIEGAIFLGKNVRETAEKPDFPKVNWWFSAFFLFFKVLLYDIFFGGNIIGKTPRKGMVMNGDSTVWWYFVCFCCC